MQSQALLEECRQRQDDEIVALESIFAATEDGDAENGIHSPVEPRVKLVSSAPDPVLELFLPVTLPKPTRITVETFAHDIDACSATASSSKLSLESSVASNSPSVVQREMAAPSSHPNNGRRRSRKQATKAGQLDATANAFSPGRLVKSEPAVQLQAGVATAEGTARALDSLSLRSKNTHDKVTHDEPLAARFRSTQRLPPLRHLPPISLRVRLPPTYPAEKPPVVESLAAPWLQTRRDSQDASLAWLLQRLDEQYQELSGTEVLYTWATYLIENIWIALLEEQPLTVDAPPFLRLAGTASDTTQTCLRFEEFLSSPEEQPLLAAQLVAHSRLCSRTTFDAASFDCAICIETRKGKACTRLTGCGHVFCSECLAGYLTSLVDDGFHRQAKRCPDPDCVTLWSQREKDNLVDQEGNLIASAKPKTKSNGAAVSNGTSAVANGEDKAIIGLVTRWELESILGTARLKRLDELTVKAKMEADPSVSYCPRSGCQAPVVRLSSDENSGHWERFRECLSCGFAFCAWCSRSWHGPTSCPISFQSELIRRYLALAESSHDRALMEQKFGRKTLETMVRKYEEEQQTQQWLSDYTTPCPTCGIAIEKSYGCNHMTCKSCQTHYCYLCGKPISSQNPYQHFNTPGYECYHRLFDGLLGDQAPQHQQQQGEQRHGDARRGQGDGAAGDDARPGFALLLDENGIPLHLEPEDHEMDLLAWQQLG